MQKQKKSVRRSDLQHPFVLLEDTCWRNVVFALERKERLAQTSRMVQQYTMLSR